uniref:RAD51_interact domain-containing protein n=1 Tax=Haemonchus contortus TaxID=6289 RepID=A0A7I4YPP5_HAECO
VQEDPVKLQFELSNNALPIVRCLFQFYIILVVSTVYHIQCLGKKKPTKRSFAGVKTKKSRYIPKNTSTPSTTPLASSPTQESLESEKGEEAKERDRLKKRQQLQKKKMKKKKKSELEVEDSHTDLPGSIVDIPNADVIEDLRKKLAKRERPLERTQEEFSDPRKTPEEKEKPKIAVTQDDHEAVLTVEPTPPPTETETSDLVTVNETPSSVAEKSQKYHSIAATPITIDCGTFAAATESSSVWASDVMKVLDMKERKPKPATFTTTSHMVGYRSDETLMDATTQPTVTD